MYLGSKILNLSSPSGNNTTFNGKSGIFITCLISQLIFDEQRTSKDLLNQAKSLGREFVIQIDGEVIERASKNQNIPTGDIEILVKKLTILNSSTTPPFTIEDNTDGGEELRMKYRYLDIRREPMNCLLYTSPSPRD